MIAIEPPRPSHRLVLPREFVWRSRHGARSYRAPGAISVAVPDRDHDRARPEECPMPVLDREEYIEQAYFFHAFRERVLDGMPAQEVLARIGEELLSTTRLPMAIWYLTSE